MPKEFNGDGSLKNHLNFQWSPKNHLTCQWSPQIIQIHNVLFSEWNFPVVTIFIEKPSMSILACKKTIRHSIALKIDHRRDLVSSHLWTLNIFLL